MAATPLTARRSAQRSLSRHALGPGIALMRRLRMPVKMGLMGLMVVLPLLMLALTAFQSLRNDQLVVKAEVAGAHVAVALIDVVVQLQAHRDLAHRSLSGDTQAREQLPAAAEALKSAVAAIDALQDARLPFVLPERWAELRTHILALAAGQGPKPHNELFALHSLQVAGLRQMMLLVGERSGLLLDPQASTYFLMDLTIERMIPWLEALGTTRSQGAVLLARGDASRAERSMVMGQATAVNLHLDDMAFRLAAVARSGHPAPASWATARTAAQRLSERSLALFSADALAGEANAFHQQGSQAVSAALLFKQDVADALLQLLAQRDRDSVRAMWLQLGVTALGLALLGYLASAFYVSFNGALRTLLRGVNKVANGDLSHRICIFGHDELSDIGALVERMNLRLSAMVAEIRSTAVRVGMSGQLVANSSQSLAERTETQASSLRQTVATVGQLSDAVAANASAASALDQLTDDLRRRAEQGGGAMRDSVAAMAGLEGSSRRMSEIIGVIDGIAFQTNILALNAAVEAARAGESGRGFAVVAAEVRSLAQRSATAASEIRGLIAQSVLQVESSVRQTRAVGQTLDEVVTGVRQVSESLRRIAQASARQSADLEQVSQSVGNLDEITRHNADMVEDSAQASKELVGRAHALSLAVASIRLRQGSADEAHALVDRALALIAQRGLAGASADFQSKDLGFVDRDLYVFVIDRAGHYRLHGAKPAMQGKRVHEVPGIDGDRFVRDAWAAAAEGGWVEYDIVNPESGLVQPKASYIRAIDTQLALGCGVYRVQAAAPA